MSLDRRTAIVIAAVGILVITAAAASVTDPTVTGGGFGPPTDWSQPTDPDNGNGFFSGDGQGDGDRFLLPAGGLCFPFLFELRVQLFLLALVLTGTVALWRYTGAITAVAAFIGIVPMGLVLYLALAAACRTERQDEFNLGFAAAAAQRANETAGGAVEVASEPFVMLLILAAIGLLAVGMVLLREDLDGRPSRELGGGEDEHEADRAQLARIAGDAARRLEEGTLDGDDLENEIYRAWVRMVEELAVDDPDTATPGEFAEEAIRVGLHPDDVHELTELFESVRYGDRPVTAERERAAIDVLGRIESHYGDAS